MDSKKLKVNLEKLRMRIPKKPKEFIAEFPKTVGESLDLYLRQRTISVMVYAGWIYDRYNWPMPLYIDPKLIRIGYLNEFMFTKLGMNDFRYFDMFGGI